MKSVNLLVALVLLVALSACSKDEPAEAPKAAAPAVEQAKQVAQQAEEKATAVVAQAKDMLNSGQVIYTKSCMSCHKMGLMGAPKVGDKNAWAALIAEGQAELVKNSIHGIGRMPAKGGNASLTDAEVEAAVGYMIEQSK